MHIGPQIDREDLAAIALAPTQFVHELLQMLRECRLRAHVSLQPFTNGIADLATGLVIDLVGIAVGLGCHHVMSFSEFHLASSD